MFRFLSLDNEPKPEGKFEAPNSHQGSQIEDRRLQSRPSVAGGAESLVEEVAPHKLFDCCCFGVERSWQRLLSRLFPRQLSSYLIFQLSFRREPERRLSSGRRSKCGLLAIRGQQRHRIASESGVLLGARWSAGQVAWPKHPHPAQRQHEDSVCFLCNSLRFLEVFGNFPAGNAPGGASEKFEVRRVVCERGPRAVDFLEAALVWEFPHGFLPKQTLRRLLRRPPNLQEDPPEADPCRSVP